MNSVLAEYRRRPKVLTRATRPDPDDEPSMSLSFRVELEAFRGPLDLLLYLVRKHEVDVVDLPIAPITDQFLAYLEVLEKLDIDRLGEFIEVAGQLIEIKSRMVLPTRSKRRWKTRGKTWSSNSSNTKNIATLRACWKIASATGRTILVA